MAKLSIEIDEGLGTLVRVDGKVVGLIESLELSVVSNQPFPFIEVKLVPAQEEMSVGLLDSLRTYRELLEQCPFVTVQ